MQLFSKRNVMLIGAAVVAVGLLRKAATAPTADKNGIVYKIADSIGLAS